MKHAIALIAMLVIVHLAHAQAPQGIPYQAAARNSSGAILASTNISVRFTIRDSVAAGVIRYRETHSVTTSAQGMFSLNVGQGTPVTGTFSGIKWGTNAKFMQVELDPAGGSSYTDMGTQQMMSVPYALNAGALKLTVSATGDTLYSGGGNYVIIPGISSANCSVGNITGTTTVIAGSTTTLSNATTGGTWSSSNTGIATIGSTGVVTGIAAGTATISYTVTISCGSAVATKVVTVSPFVFEAGASYGGGKIAYILQPVDPGYVIGETRGLIAAPSDQSTGTIWGCFGTNISGTSTAIGSGNANTELISGAACGSGTAARICADLVLGGYSDWYLPSKDEMTKLYLNRDAIGGFDYGEPYWSSSQDNSIPTTYAWFIAFYSSGNAFQDSKNATYPNVRAVRSFSYPEALIGTNTVCVGSTTTLSSATTDGTWSSSNGAVATVNSSGVVSGVSAGTVVISYAVTGSYGAGTTTRIVTVNPLPSAGTITGTATVTAGSTTTLSNATTGGAWSSSATGIATVGSTGVVTGVAAGTATISYTVTNTCGSAVATRVVTVSVPPSIGSSYGGGKIAYILQPGDPGYVEGETHGLIAATSDQGTVQWGCYGTIVGGTSTALGSGAANTAIVSDACGAGTAARLCADLVLNGYDDWYLPSRDELEKLYINRGLIGGFFTTGYYWSSSESSVIDGWYFSFSFGVTGGSVKYDDAFVRAVRSF